MAAAARESGVWLLGGMSVQDWTVAELTAGSIPEQEDGKLYNCATVWSPEGKKVTFEGRLTPGALVQTYRKTHLFDLCLPKMTYKESDTFGAGDRLATFDTRASSPSYLPFMLCNS